MVTHRFSHAVRFSTVQTASAVCAAGAERVCPTVRSLTAIPARYCQSAVAIGWGRLPTVRPLLGPMIRLSSGEGVATHHAAGAALAADLTKARVAV